MALSSKKEKKLPFLNFGSQVTQLIARHIRELNVYCEIIPWDTNVLKTIPLFINLKSQEIIVDKNEVYEYYYMKFIYNTEDWLFNSYSEMISKLGGYESQFKPHIYDYFLRELTEEKHNKICKTVNDFIESGDFRLNYNHIH